MVDHRRVSRSPAPRNSYPPRSFPIEQIRDAVTNARPDAHVHGKIVVTL